MNEKKIGTLKTNIRKLINENNIYLKIARDLSSITIEERQNYSKRIDKFVMKMHHVNGIFRVEKNHYYYHHESRIQTIINDFFIPLAECKNMDAIVLPPFNNEINQAVEKEGFSKIYEALKDIPYHVLSKDLSEGSYIKILKPGNLEKAIQIEKTIKQTFQNMQEEDVTMKVSFKTEEEEKVVNFYYQGVESTFRYVVKNGKAVLYLKEEIAETNPIKIEEEIRAYFKKVFDNQKLKNVFNYPRKHFDEYFSETFHITGKLSDTVYEHMNNYYKPQELEELFANRHAYNLQKDYKSSLWKKTRFLSIHEVIIIISPEKDVYSFKEKEINEAKEKYKQLIETQIQKEIQMSLDEIDQQFDLYQKEKRKSS